MILTGHDIPGSRDAKISSPNNHFAELQYLLSCVKFCTNTVTLLLLSEKALFLPDIALLILTHSPDLQAHLPSCEKQPGIQGSRQLQLKAETFSKDVKSGRLSTESQGKVSPGLRKRMHAPNSQQLITPASTTPCTTERISVCNRYRLLQACLSFSPLQADTDNAFTTER